jgi:hypothetical protein
VSGGTQGLQEKRRPKERRLQVARGMEGYEGGGRQLVTQEMGNCIQGTHTVSQQRWAWV